MKTHRIYVMIRRVVEISGAPLAPVDILLFIN